MSVLKCKMCGGTLETQAGETVAVCEYCGTQQTLPKLDNERKVNLYDRANHSFKTFRFRGRPVEDETIYRIGLQHFHFVNVEDFFSVPLAEITQNGEPRVIATSCRSILDEYLSANQNLERAVSGRLIVE